MNACQHCAYWKQIAFDGECRRRAPTAGMMTSHAFPHTGPQDWCGEFVDINTVAAKDLGLVHCGPTDSALKRMRP